MPTHFYKITSFKQTKKIANLLARKFLQRRLKQKGALVLALSGDLGSGKTTFIQGFMRGLGVKNKITSPTFVLIKNYKLKISNYKRAYHIDCYRIKNAGELLKLGLKEILNNPQNIVLIEWAERILRALPKNVVWLKFEHGQKINERNVELIRN